MAPVSKKTVEEQQQKADYLNSETRHILAEIRRKDARFRRVAISFFGILFFLGIMGLFYQNKLAQQNHNLAVQGRNNGLAIVNYLDCIGHIKTPVAQRTQADYDKCLNGMREAVQGN